MSKYQNGHHCYLQFACLPLRCVRLGVFHISTARASALLHFALCLLLCTSGVVDGRKAAAPALDVWKGSAFSRAVLDQPTCPLHSPTRQQPRLSQQPRPSGRWLPPGVGPTAGPWKNGHEARSKSGEACLVPDFSNTVDESILAFTFANSKNIVLFCKSPRFTNKTLAVKDIKIQPSPHSPLNVPGHVLWLHCCIFSALTGLPTQSS